MYKPNFCADCGTRIERTRWRLWTSRRFCPACDRRVGRGGLALALAACAVLCLAGFVAGRFARPAGPPPLVIKRVADAPAFASAVDVASQAKASDAKPPGTTGATPHDAARYGPDGANDERPTDPDEIVSTCGARTKKGTPCSRRVRGTGRCWQHKGRPAMLPPAKLIVQG
jgi:hypothetical protein